MMSEIALTAVVFSVIAAMLYAVLKHQGLDLCFLSTVFNHMVLGHKTMDITMINFEKYGMKFVLTIDREELRDIIKSGTNTNVTAKLLREREMTIDRHDVRKAVLAVDDSDSDGEVDL